MAAYVGDAAVTKNLSGAMNDPKKIFAGPLKGFPSDFVKMFGAVDMPAYYQGVKIVDEDSRALVRDQLEAVPNLFSMIDVGVE